MISQKVLEKNKLDTESLKAKFTAKKKDKGVENLIRVIRDRINDERRRQLDNHHIWAAVDLAYDAPFNQETPTLVRHVMETCQTADQVMKACRSWGLSERTLFCPICDDNGIQKVDANGNKQWELNAPTFFNVFVPVVRAYVTVRLAKLFNDRNLLPLHKYEPSKYTSQNRILCEIVTDVVQTMATQFGYAATLRQVIFQALLYSVCLMFPVESWYVEKQDDEDGKEFTVREGVRYVTPHITRTGWDLQHPLATLNTNTGCSFAFYWSIMRFGDLERNDQYWNTKTITYGTNWMDEKNGWSNYFKQAYPCTLVLPQPPEAKSSTDRENAALYYAESDYDKAIVKTEMFMRIKPKQWGLGEYNKEVWFRFTVASDDAIIYAEAFPYNPVLYCGYDADQNRAKNASFALEILPWQDHLGNVLTQILLTIKRNLANIVFYDADQIDDDQLKRVRRRSQWQYQELNFIPFSGMKARIGQSDVRAATHEVKFAFADTSQMTQAITTIISVLERLLVISPQEIGSSASHQQSKAEVVITTTNTNNRVTYTGTFVDEFQDAWKVQSYDAARAYMDPGFAASVSTDIPELQKNLDKLGFETVTKTSDNRKVIVKGKIKDLKIESFASTREGPDRGNDSAAAQAEYQAVQSINTNPLLSQIIDPESIVHLIENAARKAGADRDFKVRVNKAAPPADQLKEALAQAEQAITANVMKGVEQYVEKEVAAPAAKAIQEQQGQINANAKQIEQNAEQTQRLADVVAKMQEMITAALQGPPVPPVEPPMPPGPPMGAAPPLPVGPLPPPQPPLPLPLNEPELVPAGQAEAAIPAGLPA